MTTTPNMGLVLPDDQGSLNIWGGILNTIFGATKIDGHDHTTGKGVKIPSAALNVNAATSWSSGGTSYSITDLLAVDFKPSDGTAVGITALAGALFVADGTGGLSANELYWRSTSGTNVKVTSGAALNVVAFTGGIGGDYAAVGALVVFDDATDSYWFQQQIGSAVRQYARMRSADVDLYEFKANPAAGVPTNRVRLASPAALAASYALTFPGALPAVRAAVQVDSTGQLVFSSSPVNFGAALATPGTSGSFVYSGSPDQWVYYAGTVALTCPISLPVGTTITSWTLFIAKGSSGTTTISASLFDKTLATGAAVLIGSTQSTSAAAPGNTTLGQGGLSVTVTAGHVYLIQTNSTVGGSNSDNLLGWSITP